MSSSSHLVPDSRIRRPSQSFRGRTASIAEGTRDTLHGMKPWMLSILVLVGPSLAMASEGEAEGGHGGGGGLLVPPNVWAILSFLVVLAILVRKLLPPIIQVLDKRAEAIRDALEAADRARAERQALIESHAAEVERCRQEALAIVEQGRAEALQLKESLAAEARKEADAMIARGKREIEQAKQGAIEDLDRRAVNLAFDIANRLIRKNLSPADHQEMIQERIKNMPAA